MPKNFLSFEKGNKEICSSNVVVGITDKIYHLDKSTVTFDEILVKGDLSGILEYNGEKIEITKVDTIIGLEIGPQGPRGPIWKGVECRVILNEKNK